MVSTIRLRFRCQEESFGSYYYRAFHDGINISLLADKFGIIATVTTYRKQLKIILPSQYTCQA